MTRTILAVSAALGVMPLLYSQAPSAQAPPEFIQRCAPCHGADARGGEHGPNLGVARAREEREIRSIIRNGIPGSGMPAFKLAPEDETRIVEFIRGLRPFKTKDEPIGKIHLNDGRELRGALVAQSNYDADLVDAGGRAHSLRREGGEWVETAAGADWPTYHGQVGGNRHSALRQITTDNVARLAPKWIFTVPGARRLEVTPIVVDGVMYVTNANEAFALDGRTGAELWHYRRARSTGLVGDARGGINRGVAVLGDRVFMVTDNAHLIALNRASGVLEWDVEMADSRQDYGATSAPLAIGDLVISGISGGDEGARGFVAAYKASNGERVWRFWSMPAPGEPLSETWGGRAIEHGCATTWFTGTYDPKLNLIFWPTGNPCPDYNGDERKGDNLYSDSALALDPLTGKLRWHYQFTPHDVHDWDAIGTLMVVDAEFQGRRRDLLLEANRNGFFYVLDRNNGQVLLAKPFVKALTWASGIDAQGAAAITARRGADARWNEGLSRGRRRRELDVHGLQPGDRAVLCHGAREVHHLHEIRCLVGAWKIVLRGRHARRPGRAGAESAARDRYSDGQDCMGIPAGWSGDKLGRRALHGRRGDLFLRRQRRVRGRGQQDRQAAVAF